MDSVVQIIKEKAVIHRERKIDGIADRFEYITYELNGITYVPHYRNRNVFVGPGYPEKSYITYSDKVLQMMGAKPKTMLLWHRGEDGLVDERHP